MRNMARGEGKLGCIVWSALMLTVGFVALKVVPVQVAKMQLADFMEEMALTEPRQPIRMFERRIMERADELDLPLEKRDIAIRKTNKRIVMDVEFTVVFDMVIMEYPWKFEIHLDRDIFYF
ncbi:MAG: hypothetical protein AAGM22_21570 [Acidobacteriota bacterium]